VFIQPFINYAYWNLTSIEEERAVLELYPAAKTFVTPNIVDLSIFSKSPLEKDKSYFNKYTATSCEDKCIIVSMGRLHKVKGFDILIEAFDKVQACLPLRQDQASPPVRRVKVNEQDIVLLIAGEDFGERKNLEQLIDKLQLKDKVFLVGMIEGKDKIEFLRNADLFALASHHENFGIVYAEALAAGIPVIASRNTPWEEVEKYNCGKWVNNTPEDFVNAIIRLLNTDLKLMGENGRKFITENFSCDATIKKYQAMFNTILN
jgi:glycosyltransferase involved in cell wall biosynthesis